MKTYKPAEAYGISISNEDAKEIFSNAGILADVLGDFVSSEERSVIALFLATIKQLEIINGEKFSSYEKLIDNINESIKIQKIIHGTGSNYVSSSITDLVRLYYENTEYYNTFFLRSPKDTEKKYEIFIILIGLAERYKTIIRKFLGKYGLDFKEFKEQKDKALYYTLNNR